VELAVILLAGGKGLRAGGSQPKQFVDLEGKKVILYSFELFLAMPEVKEIVVVCEDQFQPIFPSDYPQLSFAKPGERRQDSLTNGFHKVQTSPPFICIHDAARPLLQKPDVQNLLAEATKTKAAALATKITSTIKEVAGKAVLRTVPRETLWEMQTPQIIETALLKKGIDHITQNLIPVTDELSIIESLGHPTSIVEGSPWNIKITHPSDFLLARAYLWQIQHTN